MNFINIRYLRLCSHPYLILENTPQGLEFLGAALWAKLVKVGHMKVGLNLVFPGPTWIVLSQINPLQ